MQPEEYQVVWKPDRRERCPARVNPVFRHRREQRVSLDGQWQFRLDPDDVGVKQKWFVRPDRLSERIAVPGCWQGQGFGHDGDDEIRDFRVRTRVFKATYKGTGWYARKFAVPADWQGKRIWLNFGGVHPAADVYVNGRRVGSHCGTYVPFAFDITRLVHVARSNTVVVRVHELNRWLGHAYNWTGNWSGLFRSVELSATGDVWLEHLWIDPDVDRCRLRLRVALGGRAAGKLAIDAVVRDLSQRRCVAERRDHKLKAGPTQMLTLTVPDPHLWSPDTPNLYRVDVTLRQGGRVADALSERTGLVKLTTSGKQFHINDRPYYIRGTGDFMVNPETGCPDVDRGRWRRKLKILRAYGYNQVRCQSYVPAPEYFDAADEVGLLIQSEMGILGAWSGHAAWHVYPWPPPTPRWRDAIQWQWDRTVMRDANHPSAAIYCMSNELGDSTLFPKVARQCERRTKAIKPGAMVIYTDGGINPDLPQDFVNADAAADDRTDLPVIQHEYRWWSSFPDVRLKKKFTGAVRPYAIRIAERAAVQHGLTRDLVDFARASQQLQYVEARTKMEACRRDNPRLAGISHFTAMDIGLSPQGIIDEFYGRKRVDAATWGCTNGDTVLMMDRDFDGRVLVSGQTLGCTLSVSDFAHEPFDKPVVTWRLTSGRRTIGRGELRYRHRPFRTVRVGRVKIDLPTTTKPVVLKLHVELRECGRSVENAWDFWLFPDNPPMPRGARVYGSRAETWLHSARSIPAATTRALPRIVLSETLDETLVEHMVRGGRVVLAPQEGLLRPINKAFGSGGYYFLPPANYPPHEDGQTGCVVRDHPILGDLPHEGFADLQFYRLIEGAPPIDLEPLGLGGVRPVVQPISTYFTCYPLAYLVDLVYGAGGLIICALDLDQKLPEARYMLSAILRCAAGKAFRPSDRLTDRALGRIIHALDYR